MKIAIVTDAIYPYTLGGSEIRNHEIAKRLVKKGHEVHIFGGKFWQGENTKVIDGVSIHGISPYTNLYSTSGKRKVVDTIRLTLNLFPNLMKNDFDVIDIASFVYFNCYLGKFVSLTKRTPLVFTWHQYFGDYLLGYFGNIKGTIAKLLELGSTKLSTKNIAVSEYVKKELVKNGIKENNIAIIKNGVDLEMVNSIRKQKKKYDLIFVGRLNYQKNLILLIESIKLVKEKIPKIMVCIVGSGEEKEKLLEQIKNFGLEKNFYFVGEIKDKQEVFRYMKSAKIFVLPSLLEGLPLTIIESNACGLPVITTKTKWNNTQEYIETEGISGILSEPAKEIFSETIINTLKDRKNIKIMSKNGIKKSKDYDWNKIADQIENYYKSLVSVNSE